MPSSAEIVVSDPWEFATVCNAKPILGCIRKFEPDELVIDLARPIYFEGRSLSRVTAKPRHVGVQFTKGEAPVAANIVFAESDAEEDGVASIGTVSVLKDV